MLASLLQKLGVLDCVVLEQKPNDKFSLVHSNTRWFSTLYSEPLNNEVEFYSSHSDYLNDFLLDATQFWNKNVDGTIYSGIWTEQSDRMLWRLEASAITKENEHFLVIINIENEFNSRQSTLQIARESLISNDKVIEQHELIRKRVAWLSTNNNDSYQTPIKELIKHTEFGVAIVDTNMRPLEQNPALHNIFDIKKDSTLQPIDIVLDLCQRQFSEFQRILSRKEKWTGEVYWLKPDTLSRWLQLTICPVIGHKNELSSWLFLLTDISRVKYLQQSNEKLTYFDVMTGLPNRQYFGHSLENAIEKSSPFFMLRVNIKNIQRINEAYGYAVGDDVLKEVIVRLKSNIDQDALLARLGGNEFAMILYLSDKQACEHIAKNLIAVSCNPITISSQLKCEVKLDIGVAQYPNDGNSPEEIMRYADLATFFGKKKEKNSINFYSEDLKNLTMRRIELEATLRHAIEKKQFELFLQPIYDLSTGSMIKAEALIRWNKPGVGLVGPDEFIHIAEETGLIITIGQWVIDEAIRLLEILHRQNKSIILSVNLSPIQVQDRKLLNMIKSSVEQSYIDVAPFLELELTEGVLIDDFDTIQNFLTEVRKLGITTAIDDFGTGYSSLSYLQKLPIDHLKIDRSFIQELNTEDNENAIVLAIIAMAKSLKLGVIAEGVENEIQQAFLKENNCHSAQGYLFSKPLPFQQFIDSETFKYINP